MVWGGISYGQQTQLHFIDGNLNAQRCRDEILMPIVVLFIYRHHLMSQYHNARPHVERICAQFLESCLNTHQTCHPLSMFGMLWVVLYHNVFHFPPISSNLTRPLKRSGTTFHSPQSTAWSTIRKGYVHEANGGHTRYWLVFWSTPLIFFKGIWDWVSVTRITYAYLLYQSCDIHRLRPNESI